MIKLPIITSSLEIGSINIKTNIIEINKNNPIYFSCINRADCCSNLRIPVTEFDISRIESVGFETFQIIDSFSPSMMTKSSNQFAKGPIYTLKRKPFDKTCTFLENKLCAIHAVIPFACRIYPFSLNVIDENKIIILVHNEAVCKSIEPKRMKESNNHELLTDILALIMNELEERDIQVFD